MVQNPVKNGCNDHCIIEYSRLFLKGSIAGHDYRLAPVRLIDYLEEMTGSSFVQAKVLAQTLKFSLKPLLEPDMKQVQQSLRCQRGLFEGLRQCIQRRFEGDKRRLTYLAYMDPISPSMPQLYNSVFLFRSTWVSLFQKILSRQKQVSFPSVPHSTQACVLWQLGQSFNDKSALHMSSVPCFSCRSKSCFRYFPATNL